MNLDREREIFEPLQNQMALARLYFVKELNMYLTSDDYADDDFTISLCMEINHGWKMWLASASREGYKLVPVDTLEECLGWAGIAMWDSPSEEIYIEIANHAGIIEAILGEVDET